MRACSLTLCLSILAASAVFADPAADEEMLVTASRTPISLDSAGAGVTIIDRAEIEARNPQFVSDLLRDVPGFAVSRNGGAGQQTQIRVRGSEANHLLVLIDGIEANDFSVNDGFDFAHLNAADIERIEIVRGPQSSLWGSDALAGVINIITRAASHSLEVQGETEHGSFGTHSGAFSLGTARDNLNARVGFSYFDTGGINVSAQGKENDGYTNSTLNAKLGWKPVSNVVVDLTGRVTGARTEFDDVSPTTGLHIDTPNTTNVRQAYVGARVQADTFDGHWQHRLAFNWTDLSNANRDAFANFTSTAGDKYALDYQSTWRFATSRILALEHSLTLAMDYEHTDFHQRGAAFPGFDPNLNHQLHTVSGIAEYRAQFADGTTLAASGRWDDNSDFKSVGTYRVSASHEYKPTATTVSAAYGTGQKSPTFFDRFGFAGGGFPFIGNPTLRPATSRGFEVGFRQRLCARRCEFGVTYFDERLENEIDGFVPIAATGTFTARNLDGVSDRSGVELSGMAELGRAFTVHGSYTYLDASQQKHRGDSRTPEIRRPHNQAAASVNWFGFERKLTADLHVTYTGTRDDTAFLPPLFNTAVALRPYTLVGLSLAYAINPLLTLTGRVENAFSEHYQEVFDFQSEGIAGYVGLKLNFGR